MEETPHVAKLVKCKAAWMSRATKRCSSCGKIGSHRIHVKLNA